MLIFKVSPAPYRPISGFLTLLEKEILRFKKMALQTVLAPIIMSFLYLMVFGQVLADKMPTFSGVNYIHFLVPGLIMMTLLQNAFGNASSSLLGSKVMGSLIFIQLPPFSGWQISLAVIGASIVRGLIVGAGVFVSSCFWGMPHIEHPLWVLIFAFFSAMVMGSLGVICGLWADKFDQMGAFQSFVIMPLTFLSGVFYSINQLPPLFQTLSRLNPFFYMIDGFRYGFFADSDFNPWLSLSIVVSSAVILLFCATLLLQKGYKITR